jgi:hypothetical protein
MRLLSGRRSQGGVASERCQHGRRAPEGRTQFVSFGAGRWRIAFTDCADVVEGLEAILHGWNVREHPRSVKVAPHAHIKKTSAGRYSWRSHGMGRPEPWRAEPPTSPMNVICDVHDVFFDWFLKEHPRHLCLHAAAVRMGRGLVCFPSVHKAGKSMLSVALAALGQRVYGDDVLPVEPRSNCGMAMGIMPRLRRPLPPDLGTSLLEFVTRRAGPADKHWLYVKLRGSEIASFGEHAPIVALVFLQRENGTKAKFARVSESEMLKELILQNFADQVPPVAIMDRLLALTKTAQCGRLQFQRVADAARLLVDRFASPD